MNLCWLRFVITKIHLKGAEFVSLITRIFRTELAVLPDMLVAYSRDSVLVSVLACKVRVPFTFTSPKN